MATRRVINYFASPPVTFDAYVVGTFTQYQGDVRNHYAKLQGPTFDFQSSFNNTVIPAIGLFRYHSALSGGRIFAGSFRTVRKFDPESATVDYNVTLAGTGGCTGLDVDQNGLAVVSGISLISSVNRLDAAGAYDPTWSAVTTGISVDGDARVLDVKCIGNKVYIAGDFSYVKDTLGAPHVSPLIARLNSDGTVDTAFTSGLSPASIQCTNILLSGSDVYGLTSNTGVSSQFIWKLNSAGAVDGSFGTTAVGNLINSFDLKMSPSGNLYVSIQATPPAFGTYPWAVVHLVVGVIDATFEFTGGGAIYDILPNQDGTVLVVGAFASVAYNGGALDTVANITKLTSTGAFDATFVPVTTTSGIPSSISSILR